MVAPPSGLGFAYYVTDGLSLRPWLGLGYSDYNGFFASAGAQLRFKSPRTARSRLTCRPARSTPTTGRSPPPPPAPRGRPATSR